MSDLDIAISRLTDWLVVRYGPIKSQEFVKDIELVVLAAKESQRLQDDNYLLRERLHNAVTCLTGNVVTGVKGD